LDPTDEEDWVEAKVPEGGGYNGDKEPKEEGDSDIPSFEFCVKSVSLELY
jgi:hypothetical protein